MFGDSRPALCASSRGHPFDGEYSRRWDQSAHGRRAAGSRSQASSCTCAYSLKPLNPSELADKTVDIRRIGDRIEFREHGDEVRAITLVVGQTIRWKNKDAKPHRLVSDAHVDGAPLFDTGIIGPGEHKDFLVDIDLYSKAGGKPANVIRIKYHSTDHEECTGELQIVSAARRGFSRYASA